MKNFPPRCPICAKGMGTILGSDNEPSCIIHWCPTCQLDHFETGRYWKWNGTTYNEEQFEKALQLKAFW